MPMNKFRLRRVATLASLLLIFGCGTPVPQGTSIQQSTSVGSAEDVARPVQPPPEPQSRSGLRLSDASERALKLEPGMSQDAVRKLLGAPDETSSATYGAAVGAPWQGVAWTYKWQWGSYVPTVRRLEILFQHDYTSWDVNSWKWYDY